MSIWGSITGSDAIEKAAKIQAKATRDAIAAQQLAADQATGYYRPYSAVGENALNKLSVFAGLNGAAAQREAYDQYMESPDVQFLRDQGENALERRAAAGGHSQVAGKTIADAIKFNQGLSSQAFGDYINRVTNLKDTGFQGASGSAGVRSNAGANTANLISQGGANQAQLAMQKGMIVPSIIGSTIGAGANLLGRWAEGGFKNPFGTSGGSSSSYNPYAQPAGYSYYGGPR